MPALFSTLKLLKSVNLKRNFFRKKSSLCRAILLLKLRAEL